jgi:hypothetical protein
MVALLVPLTEGRALGWPVWTWLLFALAPIAAAAAVYVERRIEQRGGAPLIAPSLVRLPSMWRGLVLAIPFFIGFGAFMFVFALAVQDGLGYSPLRSGLALAPMSAAFLAGSLLAPKLVARFGGRTITLAMAAEAIVLVALAIQVLREWPHIGTFAMSPELVVGGFAQAVTLVTLFRTVLADVPHRLAGIGSGVLVTVQQAALALGVASIGSLYLSIAGASAARAFAMMFVTEAVLFGAVAVGGWLLLGGAAARAERPVQAGDEPAAAIEL